MEFSEWIVAELEKRGWSRSEAARRGNISPSMFDKVINGYSKPGVKFIEGIARAFNMSPAEVMIHMENQPEEDPWMQQMEMKLRRLPSGMRSVVGRFIDSMLQGEDEQVGTTKPKPKDRSKKG
jgi:transcriptional regulator with XRE-family HTH domain